MWHDIKDIQRFDVISISYAHRTHKHTPTHISISCIRNAHSVAQTNEKKTHTLETKFSANTLQSIWNKNSIRRHVVFSFLSHAYAHTLCSIISGQLKSRQQNSWEFPNVRIFVIFSKFLGLPSTLECDAWNVRNVKHLICVWRQRFRRIFVENQSELRKCHW